MKTKEAVMHNWKVGDLFIAQDPAIFDFEVRRVDEITELFLKSNDSRWSPWPRMYPKDKAVPYSEELWESLQELVRKHHEESRQHEERMRAIGQAADELIAKAKE